MPELSLEERLVLLELACMDEDEGCVSFKYLAQATNVDAKLIPHVCRLLRARGLAEYYAGLWTMDGRPAGAGYCVTERGREVAEGRA